MAAVSAVSATAPATVAPPVAKDVASARKRRRRAPAGGAADDCFTCAKRNVKCDRRRPYCSQCLEIGNECSGYKTQLTWGVGVASRGKLRGLSLPIAKAPPVNPGKTVKSPTKSRAGSIVVHNQWPEQQQQAQQQTQEQQTAQQQQQPSPPHQQQQQSPPHHHHPHPHVHQPPKRDHRDVRENVGRRSSLQVPPTPFLPPGYELPRMSSVAPTESLPAMMSQPAGWTPIPFHTGMPSNEGHRFPNRNLHLTLPGTGEMLGSSMDSMSEVDYMSPLTHSFPRDDMPFIHSPTVLYDSNTFPTHSSPIPRSPLSAIMMEPQRVPTTGPSLVYSPSEPTPSLPNLASMSSHSHVDNFDTQLSHKMDCDPIVSGTSDMDAYSTSAQSHGGFWATSSTDDDSVSQSVTEHNPPSWPVSLSLHSPTPTPSSLVPLNPELIAKMPFFMDYYENTMCPSMVFIDSPGNPFRDHILQLGTGSRSLQHAICALAACNLRMKRKLSLGQHSINIDDKRLASAPTDLDTQPEDQSLSEEYQHRNLAVHLLNEQLNDPDKSRHDSVLATILLLCHYRMAESGIAKFHTQFAGVRKILSMRRASPSAPSRDSAWMEALFTYFDAISASINDREAQLNTSFYGVLPDAQLLPLGAENLVGCDRELFKTIIKLGRLNLLSQHRPVQNLLPSSPRPHAPSSRSASPLDSHASHTFKPSRPLNADHLFSSPPPPTTLHQSQLMNGGPVAQPPSSQQQNQLPRFDGNGFVKTLDDDDLLGATALHAPTSPPIPMTPAAAASAYDDRHNNFWREWKDARIALQSWEFDAGRVLAGMPLLPPPPGPASAAQIPHPSGAAAGGGPTAAQVRDLGHLSEAFRYAALLYTERLASPNVPSAHANFRNLVNQVVYYATSLEAGSAAEKFLLWPLFVAGSECVNELQQNIVRSKCRDIMARSGYMNNLAALDVLERLWAGDWKEMDLDMGNGGKMGPFNWTKCIGGPGIEVEWIMF